MVTPAWIAVDWGTTNLRVWAMDASGEDIAHATSDQGMSGLSRDGFEPALLALIAPWLDDTRDTPVIACGMVGSRQGWVEAAYTTVPCDVLPATFAQPEVIDPRISVHVIPGVSQTSPADVMRGEETQIAGFLKLNPKWDGIICLPGTHTKWVQVSAGEIVSFQTFMTGEIFALLSDASVLRHSIGSDGWDEAAFEAALGAAQSRPEALASRLFSLRAESLLADLSPASARARLSGLLIGAELAAARPYWLGQQVAVIGASSVAENYTKALSLQGTPATQADGGKMTLKGLQTAFESLR